MAFKTLPPQASEVRLLEGVKPGKAVSVNMAGDEVSLLVLKEGKEFKVALVYHNTPSMKDGEYSIKGISNYQPVDKFEGTLTCYAAIGDRSECPESLKDLDPTKLYALSAMINDKKRVDAKYVFSPNSAAVGKVTNMEGDEVTLPFGYGFFVHKVEAYVGGE